jgi:hypothetical protein
MDAVDTNSAAGVVYAKGDTIEEYKRQGIRMTRCAFKNSSGSDIGIDAGAQLFTDDSTDPSPEQNVRGRPIQQIADIPPNFRFLGKDDAALHEIQAVRTCGLSRRVPPQAWHVNRNMALRMYHCSPCAPTWLLLQIQLGQYLTVSDKTGLQLTCPQASLSRIKDEAQPTSTQMLAHIHFLTAS